MSIEHVKSMPNPHCCKTSVLVSVTYCNTILHLANPRRPFYSEWLSDSLQQTMILIVIC